MTIKLITKCIPVCLLAILSLAISCGTEKGGERSTAGETEKQVSAKQQADSEISLIHSVVDKTSSQKQFVPSDRAAQIAAIRKEFARLQPLLTELPKYSFSNDNESEAYYESIEAWTEGGEFVKVSSASGGDHGGSGTDYYLKDGKLFFCYSTEGSFFYSDKGPSSKVKQIRKYFADVKLIYHLVKEYKFTGDEKVNMDKIPNEEMPLPVDVEREYLSLQASVEELIRQLSTQTDDE
ncbi:MAG: hypothetical protein AB8H47_08910 [Bacteroidia bacterium]